MTTNWRQVWAKQKAAEERIVKAFGDPTEASGVYKFSRFNNERFIDTEYIGQAKNLRRRIAQHLLEHDRLGLSLKKHGLKTDETPKGWNVVWQFVPLNKLDYIERIEIDAVNKIGQVELYNVTSGGQGVGKVDINPRAPAKTYRDGLKQGHENARKELLPLFEKYLDIETKGNTQRHMNAVEKLQKFLKGETK